MSPLLQACSPPGWRSSGWTGWLWDTLGWLYGQPPRTSPDPQRAPDDRPLYRRYHWHRGGSLLHAWVHLRAGAVYGVGPILGTYVLEDADFEERAERADRWLREAREHGLLHPRAVEHRAGVAQRVGDWIPQVSVTSADVLRGVVQHERRPRV